VRSDGSGFVGYQPAGQNPEILTGMKNGSTGYTNASLSGTFNAIDYSYASSASQPHLQFDINALPVHIDLQQNAPPGFRSEFLAITFDGDGTFDLTDTKNQDGTVSSSPQSGTYSVADDGSVSINGGTVLARLNSDSSGFVGYQPSGQDPEILVGMKTGAGPYNNASLNGAYTAIDYQFASGAQQPHQTADISANGLPYDLNWNQAAPLGFRSEFLTITFHGDGTFDLTDLKNQDGSVSSTPQSGTYSVASDGSISIGGSVLGQLNADGSGFVGYQPAGQDPEILVVMKN